LDGVKKKKWVIEYRVGSFKEEFLYASKEAARQAAAHIAWVYRNTKGVSIVVREE